MLMTRALHRNPVAVCNNTLLETCMRKGPPSYLCRSNDARCLRTLWALQAPAVRGMRFWTHMHACVCLSHGCHTRLGSLGKEACMRTTKIPPQPGAVLVEAALRHVYTNADARAGSAHARVASRMLLDVTRSYLEEYARSH